ncbi:uncharacterized protein [Drosophila takahashii]|uniref:uncharacterized protein n=1 Tax=Drosophila takahashii TaxID=29030 RepID=UPI0007E7E7CD|nr:uncharacterized protein LOC108066765 [Drosophila takahashii]XP_017010906.1 uncharacterized protein LOC108066765 [Drosophila takahashii]XP_017010908.1 uncharacterized protein LOC108066765 [Drosophila takahashii]XP_017010909.1 uncharacterized protein LOC108066765 [Drosophila takahashii]XP_017010910.1 uncharacterized protein LOC108066765 [Drosophila takahashii]XP_017010911.1 uncharacterized protein LOC108066765 [Drosophila takahashii]XP_017010912.1 uncharacterized protein LOC108066765 [Drosop
MNSSIDKAKHFFAESGILGPTNLKDSHDFIRKTSTIHIDTSLQNQIRKTSLCLRTRVFNETNTLNTFDDSILNLQNEICNIREALVNGETKIVILRTEIGKLKQALQAIIHVHMEARNYPDEITMKTKNPTPSLCLFCQPINSSIKGSPSSSSTYTNRSKTYKPNNKVVGERMKNKVWIDGK